MESVLTHGGSAQSHTALSSTSSSAGVSATSAGSWGAARAIIAVQKQRQAITEKTAMSLVRRSAVRKRAASARQPDFSTLWNNSIFQRHALFRLTPFRVAPDRLAPDRLARLRSAPDR